MYGQTSAARVWWTKSSPQRAKAPDIRRFMPCPDTPRPAKPEVALAKHVAEAGRLGLEVRVLRAPDLMVDIDVAEDLHHLESPCRTT